MINGKAFRAVPGGVEVISLDWTVRRFISNTWYEGHPEFDGIPIERANKTKRQKNILKRALERA